MKKTVMKKAVMWGMVLVLVGCLAGMAQARELTLAYPDVTGMNWWYGDIVVYDRTGVRYDGEVYVDIPEAFIVNPGFPGFAGRYAWGWVWIGFPGYGSGWMTASAQQSTVVPGAAVSITFTAPISAVAPMDLTAAAGLSIAATLTSLPGRQGPILQGSITRAGRWHSALRLAPE